MATKSLSSEQFVAGLAKALGRDTDDQTDFETAFPNDEARQLALQEQVANRRHGAQLALLDQLTTNAKTIAVDVIPLTALDQLAPAIVDLIRDIDKPATVVAWDHPLMANLGLAQALAEHGTDLVLPGNAKKEADHNLREKWRRAAARAVLGITSADYCIAETATLVMRSRPGQPRSASLLPEVHAAVITLDQIIADPAELFALMGSPAAVESQSVTRCMTWVSSNSKTGDIEAVLVPGVHGPKRVVIYVITDPLPSGTGPRKNT